MSQFSFNIYDIIPNNNVEKIDPSANNNEAIIVACKNGNIEVVEKLLNDHRVNPGDRNNLSIIMACINGHTQIVEMLLKDKRVDPSDRNNRSILWACVNGHIQIVEMLLKDPRVDASVDDNTIILGANKHHYKKLVRMLLFDKKVTNHKSFKIIREKEEFKQPIDELVKLILTLDRLPSKKTPFPKEIVYKIVNYCL